MLNIFQSNSTLLVYLFQNKIITPDKETTKLIMENNNNNINLALPLYLILYPEIENSIEPSKKEQIELEISNICKCQLNNQDFNFFYENVKKGENESYICEIIRNDSIDDFIFYLHQTNSSPQAKIPLSLFESNSFLVKKQPTMIKYSMFFGSIRIFKYLLLQKGIELDESDWLYAIHGQNSEIISIIEEKTKKARQMSVSLNQ